MPVDIRVFTQTCGLADSGLMEVVKSDDRQYTQKHSKVLMEAIAAGIEELEYRRKVQRKVRVDHFTSS